MKRVRVRIHPGEADLPRTFEAVTGAAEEYASVEVVNWNVVEPPAAFLLRVTGDVSRFESVLGSDDAVDEYELLPLGDDECYCFLTGTGTPDARRLWETFARGSLMTVPPAEWNADGSYTFTVVGRDADIQAAVDHASEHVRVEIESVGNRGVAAEGVRDRLTDRQREVVEAAIELGYYETPRAATSEDVADELGCATSTAAEHLRKAESRLVVGLFGE